MTEKVTPVRVQRSRQHKQVSPNGLPVVYVGRPSKWGNPFKIGQMSPNNFTITVDAEHCVQLFRQILDCKKEFGLIVSFLKPLRGKNLSCWCKVGEPCHADVLLEMANK